MFKPHYGKCKQCGESPRLIPTKRGLCQWCERNGKVQTRPSLFYRGIRNGKRTQNNTERLSKGNDKKSISRTPNNARTISSSKKPRTNRKQSKATGELELFKRLYEERDPWCEWCGKGIIGFSVVNYHHIKPKSRFPELRLVESNIVKICFDCHFKEHNC